MLGGFYSDNQEEIARFLILHGADFTLTDEDGVTPLMLAAANGMVAVVQMLLAKGADPLMKDANGATAYAYAMGGGHQEIGKLLMLGL